MPLNRNVRNYGRRAERKALESSARSKARQQLPVEAMDNACPSSKTDEGEHCDCWLLSERCHWCGHMG